MNMVNVRNILVALISLASILISCTGKVESPEITRVLILSGQNNHEWQKTSPLIEEELQNSGLFSTFVTNNPDTLTFNNLKSFDVIVSNWNKWPDTSFRLDRKWEKDLTRFIKKGGGFVSIHAGSSLFYGWG